MMDDVVQTSYVPALVQEGIRYWNVTEIMKRKLYVYTVYLFASAATPTVFVLNA